MLIISDSRSDTSFNDLIEYVEPRAVEGYYFEQNIGFGSASLSEKFIRNSKFLEGAKGKNFLFHEVISIERVPDASPEDHYEALLDLAENYLQENKRGENLLAWGKIHHDHENNIHMHLILSANEAGIRKRFELSQDDF